MRGSPAPVCEGFLPRLGTHVVSTTQSVESIESIESKGEKHSEPNYT